ncbi:MAG: glycosyltransferase family 2 protein [Pirellulales bacterium]|nr:glycosyltransferase family 2 protein [Pirellulales bacterium]
MKISVALCTYNGGRFLQAQLESIAAQHRRPDELVVCDDRSTDDSMAVVRRFAAACGFEVRAEVNERNLGSTQNFSRAVSRCRGDIIALADQDDLWLPNKLRRLEGVFAEDAGVGVAFSDAALIDDAGRRLPRGLWESIAFDRRMRQQVNGGRALEVLVKRNVATGACMAFRAEYRELLLPIPGKWVHDGWFALLIAAVAPCRAIAEPLVEYRQHGGQQIGARKENLYRQFLRGMRQKRDDFAAISENYAEARRRLAAFRSRLRDDGALRLLDEKAEHFRAKALMREPRIWRYPIIVRELLRRHYARYSRGWRSMAQDLFM